MVLVDTSVWIRFLRGKEPFRRELDRLLSREAVAGHRLVFGELLIGDTGSRRPLLDDYEQLARAEEVAHEEVVTLVRSRKLAGRGLGWVDAHLLASALVSSMPLYTADEALADAAHAVGIQHRVRG